MNYPTELKKMYATKDRLHYRAVELSKAFSEKYKEVDIRSPMTLEERKDREAVALAYSNLNEMVQKIRTYKRQNSIL